MTSTTRPADLDESSVELEILARRARFFTSSCRIVAWAAGGSVVGLVAWWLFYREYTQLLVDAAIILPAVITAALYLILRPRNRGQVLVYLLVVELFAVIFALALTMPGTIVGTGAACIALILLGTLVLGPAAGRWLFALCSLGFVVVTSIVEIADPQWFTPLPAVSGQIISIALSAMAMIVTAAMTRQVLRAQETYFRDSRRARREVEQRVEAGREQRARLEQANLEIERRATAEREQREHLQRVLAQVRDAAHNLDLAASGILAEMSQQVQGAAEQSAAVSQIAAVAQEVHAIANRSMTCAREMAGDAQRTVEVSRSGQEIVQDTVASMGRVKGRVEDIARNILALSGQTEQIGAIIATVSELASQSNLLALNAAVEAARAGEHGRGFGVVAREVRELAEQSRQATARVRALLHNIQAATNAVVLAVEEGTREADAGVRLAAQGGEALQHLAGVIDESARTATRLAAEGGQQAAGIEQIVRALASIDQGTTQNLAGIRQVEQAARGLDDLAGRLAETVEQYQG